MIDTTPIKPRRRWRRWLLRGFAILVLVYLVVCALLAAGVVLYERTDERRPADVIIVLGSGLRRDNTPGPAIYRRAGRAAELYAAGLADTILCTGGQTAGRTRSEAAGCAEVLMQNGVPESAILLEERSRSTEENALYAGEIMRERGFTDALLVSDGYHLWRAGIIFGQAGITTYPVPAIDPPTVNHAISVVREVAALQWLAFKTVFNLPFTYVPVI